MIHVYVEITFLSISTFSKVMFKILRKLAWLCGLCVIPTVIGVVLGNRVSKKMFSIASGEKSICT